MRDFTARYSFSLLRVSAPAARRDGGRGEKKGQRKERTTEEGARARERGSEAKGEGRGGDIYE